MALDASDISDLKTHLGQRSIVLIGLMGSGKSSVGKRLAAALDLSFKDADTEIEVAANMTVSEIFEAHGEEAFRSGEQRVIARLLSEGPQVLATGGGAWINEITRQEVDSHGVSIWLDADLDVLLERVGRRSNRPLLQRGDPRKIMQNLLNERNPFYQQSDIRIISRDVPHETVVEEIAQAVLSHLRAANQKSEKG